MRQILIILAIVLGAIGLAKLMPHDEGKLGTTPEPNPQSEAGALKSTAPAVNGPQTVVMTIAGKGDITLVLDPKAAPRTVAEFVRLVKSGYYNKIKFHRVIPNFVAQAGDPETRDSTSEEMAGAAGGGTSDERFGQHDSGVVVPFEENDLKNEPFTVAMALKSEKSDTGAGQFFINLVRNSRLDGNYCVFGKVTQGQDVVNKIKIGDTIQSAVLK